MVMKIKLLALLLALITVVSTFASCGGTKGTETDIENTESETDAVTETESEIETDANIEKGPDDLLLLDFKTTLSVVEYLDSVEGTSANAGLHGGVIADGKWVYNGSPLAFSDECGIFNLKRYSFEFDMCFKSFVNRDSTSVFSIITDDDGTLDGSSSFFPLKMDMDGKLYHFNRKNKAIQLELGKVYHVKYEIDRENDHAILYLNGEKWEEVSYPQTNKAYNCYRFMDVSRGADMWFDNFLVKKIRLPFDESELVKAYAIDAAYVRAGSHAATPQKLADGIYVDIKEAGGGNMQREGLLKFDISDLTVDAIESISLVGKYVNMTAERTFNIYWVDSDWDGQTVTYNDVPTGELIAEAITFTGKGARLDLAEYVKEALDNGETEFSIKIVPLYQEGSGQTRIYFDEENKPYLEISDEYREKNYYENLVADKAANDAIWAWAQKMYDEWYARYQKLPAVNENAEMIHPDQSQYTKTNYASGNAGNYASTKKPYKTRPLEAITDLDQYVSEQVKNAKLDRYGGLMVESLKQKATGFFYTVKIDGRWWMIDPLGYPYFSIGLSNIHYSLNGSSLQRNNALKLFGTLDNWALATTKEVREYLNFNSTFNPPAEMRRVDDLLPYIAPLSVMSRYGSAKGHMGSTKFTQNGTMPVFDPDFVSYAKSVVKEQIVSAVKDPNIIGYTTDNELPMQEVMLDNALTVDHRNPINHYTYACTWTWLVNITGKEDPSFDDVTDELRDLYRGFVYDRYYYIVEDAIRAVDTNHMYMGSKYLTVSKDSEWVHRFAAQYLDCMTINWYFCWEPESEALYGFERNSDLPFVVTEFYTKAGDSGLGNSSGAGWYVATQTDRADYYDTFTLKLLESNNCVGWQLFHYMDNDPSSGTTDKTSVDSNKGLYNSEYEIYTDFADRVLLLNENVYKLLDYFKNKK